MNEGWYEGLSYRRKSGLTALEGSTKTCGLILPERSIWLKGTSLAEPVEQVAKWNG